MTDVPAPSESTLRRAAKILGWRLLKSRARKLHINNHGKYRLVSDTNTPVEGLDYDADLAAITRTLNIERKRLGLSPLT